MKCLPLFFYLFAFILNIGCAQTVPCDSTRLGNPEKIFSLKGNSNGKVSYSHFILINGINEECLDSAAILTVLNNYIDTLIDRVPISSIDVFKSKEYYDEGETLSQPEGFFKNQVLSVWFDEKSRQPETFIFYHNGKEVYKGKRCLSN